MSGEGSRIATAPTVLAGPVLPAQYEGQNITWRPWRSTAHAVAGRPGQPRTCGACGHVGTLMAFGDRAVIPGVTRFYAHHCPACGELRIHWRPDSAPGRRYPRLRLIAGRPARTAADGR